MKSFFKILFFVFLLAYSGIAFSQHEYLATVDPSTGGFAKLDSIPGVKYVALYGFTCIEQVNNRVIFLGGPSETEFDLISLDASTRKIFSQSAFSDYRKFLLFSYSSTNGILFGITVQSGVYSLVTINPATGKYSIRGTLNIDEVTEMIADDLHDVIYLRGVVNGIPKLFTINVTNASVIGQVASASFNLEYDNSKGKLYGIDANFFGSIDPATGSFTALGSLPPSITAITQGNSTFDERDQLYIFTGNDNLGHNFLYSIDANTGNIIYKAPVSLSNDITKENLIQFRFNNSSGKLYAMQGSQEPELTILFSFQHDAILSAKIFRIHLHKKQGKP